MISFEILATPDSDSVTGNFDGSAAIDGDDLILTIGEGEGAQVITLQGVVGSELNEAELRGAGASRTFVVDDDGTIGQNGVDFNSIQAAVDAARDGDTIEVRAGRYEENVNDANPILNIDKDLTILGANAGAGATEDRQDEAVIATNVNVASEGVTIDGFTFDGTGSLTKNASILVRESAEIKNSIFSGDELLRDEEGKSETGIDTVGRADTTYDVTISGNSFKGYDFGVYINGGADVKVENNLFEENRIGVVQENENDVSVNAELISNTFVNNVDHQTYFQNRLADASLDGFFNGDTFTGAAPELTIAASSNGASTINSQTIVGSDANDNFIVLVDGPVNFVGGAGADTLNGSSGADTLSGGADSDLFLGSFAELNGDILASIETGEVINLDEAATSVTYNQDTGELVISGADTLTATLTIGDDADGTFAVNPDGDVVFTAASTGGGGGGGGGGTRRRHRRRHRRRTSAAGPLVKS